MFGTMFITSLAVLPLFHFTAGCLRGHVFRLLCCQFYMITGVYFSNLDHFGRKTTTLLPNQ